ILALLLPGPGALLITSVAATSATAASYSGSELSVAGPSLPLGSGALATTVLPSARAGSSTLPDVHPDPLGSNIRNFSGKVSADSPLSPPRTDEGLQTISLLTLQTVIKQEVRTPFEKLLQDQRVITQTSQARSNTSTAQQNTPKHDHRRSARSSKLNHSRSFTVARRAFLDVPTESEEDTTEEEADEQLDSDSDVYRCKNFLSRN
ncbi:hypothetical protein J3R30DRAFT_3733982, partial [Lentinula aciculospora]